MNYQFLNTPIGTLRLVSDGSCLVKVEFQGRHQTAAGETQRHAEVVRLSGATVHVSVLLAYQRCRLRSLRHRSAPRRGGR